MRATQCLILAVLVLPATSSVAGCGARTPIGWPEPSDAALDAPMDASTDARVPRDAGPDVRDLGPDVADAALDMRVPCIPGRFDLNRPVARMMLVIDASGSMDFALDGSIPTLATPSRWTLLADALREALPPFDATEVGLKLYPEPLGREDPESDPSAGCRVADDVDVVPAAAQTAFVHDRLLMRDPNGGTPTAEAVRVASEWLVAHGARNVANFIVLATDGGPNCNPALDHTTCTCTSLPIDECRDDVDRGVWRCLDGDRTVERIDEAARARGIPVYVVGIDDPLRPDLVDLQNQMAIAGRRPRAVPGEPSFHRIRRAEELSAAFSEIAGSVAQCTFVSPSAPEDPDAITISLDGEPLPRSHEDGWDWIDPVFGTIGLFGTACARAAAGAVVVTADVMCR